MSVNFEAFGIDRLTVPERLELIERIWDTLPETVEPSDVPEWHRAELAKRRGEADANPGVGRPWKEVLDELKPQS